MKNSLLNTSDIIGFSNFCIDEMVTFRSEGLTLVVNGLNYFSFLAEFINFCDIVYQQKKKEKMTFNSYHQVKVLPNSFSFTSQISFVADVWRETASNKHTRG